MKKVKLITRQAVISVPPYRLLYSILLMLAITTCSTQTPQVRLEPSPSPTSTSQPATIPVPTEVPVTSTPPACDNWQSLPVIPVVSDTARIVYQRGQASGNNPHAFSKIGDGEISTAWFFIAFDLGEDYYDLGTHQNLLPAIEHFEGSFERIGVAARRGFNTQLILDPSASDPNLCESGESPLSCELRLHRPAFAILSLGTNQAWRRGEFAAGMRPILDILLSNNVVPILSTKGDNLEGDHGINLAIACLAQEYDVPLWNFWSAIQTLPNHGLQPDLEHLTYGINDFDDMHAMQTAWTLRNLTALQALDAVWRGAAGQP
jgi:hypothetical protein